MVDYIKRPAKAADSTAAPGGVSLSKVTLSKSAPSISLTKGQGAGGRMRINLNWTQRPPAASPSGGFLKKMLGAWAGATLDLDLGCLWETSDGRKGVVQALGNSYGALDTAPYIMLDGDDRSGANTGGENLTINLDHLAQLKRVLVFAFIYEGAPNWAAADGVVTVFPQDAAPIEVRLDEASSDRRFCAIAMLTNDGGALRIDREVQYVKGSQAALDQAYGWGMNWQAGRK